MVEDAGPVIVAHMAVGAYLVAGDLPERRLAAICPGHGYMTVRTGKPAVGACNIGIVP